MIKFSLSLKTSVVLAFLLMGIVIVLGYSILSFSFYFRGMDSIMSVNMETALQNYLQTYNSSERQQLQIVNGFSISPNWHQQPAEIQQVFEHPPTETADIQLHKSPSFPLQPRVVYFLIAFDKEGQRFYVSQKGTKDQASPLIGKNAHKSKRLLYGITTSMLIILILIVWFLLRKFSQPITQLQQWTNSLSADNLKQPLPDFVYPELNNMATLIRDSLSSVHDSLEREHNFLRFTSHELRTPISVIRNNIQLIRKIETTTQAESLHKNKAIIDRIDRASLTMQHLSETLLWLNRDNLDNLPAQTLFLDDLISSIVDELRYLLTNKQVEVVSTLEHYEIQLPKVATHIVISNLIRNAFQHTWSGRIEITQQQNQITITNHCELFESDEKPSDTGFGLGLRLTEQLCGKLQWPYQNIRQSDGHKASITLQNQLKSAE